MKKSTVVIVLAVIIVLAAGITAAQERETDRVTVELTNPSEPAFLSVGLVSGGITVTGYDGNEVIVEAISMMPMLSKTEKKSTKAEGMKRLPINSNSISVEENNNKVEISTDSWVHPVDLVIKVPFHTSLDLSCVNQGDIRVENVTGDVSVNNVNGKVTLLNIDGSVVANALNQNITVTFRDVDPEKDMSFSSMNGDIDVTFPATLKAKVKIKSTQGEVYTDFDIHEIESPERVVRENHRSRSGKYEVSIDRSFWGEINGGGQTIQFSNFNGDIFIREGK